MKRILLASLILMIGLALLIAPAAFAEGAAEAGKAVFDKKCATCHGKDGAGNEKMAAALKVEIRHLGSKEVQEKTDEQIQKDFTTDHGKKKAVKGLSEDDVKNVIAYVRSLKKKE